MALAELAVKRPIATVVLLCFVVLLGGVSVTMIPVDLLPKLEIPMVVVSTSYSGAGAPEVETMVTRPIEQAVSAVANVTRVRSVSAEGSSIVVAEFTWGTNMESALRDTRDKVDLVVPFLPSEADKPLIIKADPSLMPVMRVGFAGSHDLLELTRLAKDVVQPALERVDGVAMVNVEGGVKEEVEVVVDPARLTGYGISLSQVSQTLRFENLNIAGGSVELASKKAYVRSVAEFQTVEDIGAIILPTRASGQSGGAVFLRDIAQIRRGYKQPDQLVRIDGQPSVVLSVQKQTGANTVQVTRQVRRALDQLSSQLPAGIKLVVLEDQARFIESAVTETFNTAWQGGLLAALVLLLFLQSLTSTLIIAVSMPVSIVATFFFMYASGITMNLLSIGGLALGVGMLVDNSIVVLESVFRHQLMGKPMGRAALDGSREVGSAVLGSTLTTVVVFLPILFIKGFAAELFRELGLTVSFALAMSLAGAMTVIPLGSARLDLRPSERPAAQKVRAWLSALEERYRLLLQAAISKRVLTILAAIALMSAGVLSLSLVGFEFLPQIDQRLVGVDIRLPEGASLERTASVVRELESELLSRADIDMVLAVEGGAATSGRLSSRSSTNMGSLTVRLKEGATTSTQHLVEQLRQRASRIPGATISVNMKGGIAGSEYVFGKPISLQFKGDDTSVLAELSRDAASRISKVPGTREITTSVGEGTPELRVRVDRRRAAAFGLSSAQVGTAIKAALEGDVATRYRVGGKELDVRVRFPQEYCLNPHDLEYLPLVVPTSDSPVPLRALATLEHGVGPLSIERENQVRTVSVTAEIYGRTLGDVSRDVKEAITSMKLPQGYSVEVSGATSMMVESFKELSKAMVLAVVLVYMVMAAQFESLTMPLVIMLTVPFAISGVFIALALTRISLSIPSMIGIITLAGVVVNNGIVLLDYTMQLRREGMARENALVTAAATRLRPVLMTTTTTVLGLIPMAIPAGRGHEIRVPIAVTLIGGLTLSTILTLVVVPVFYLILDDFTRTLTLRRSSPKLKGVAGATAIFLAVTLVFSRPQTARASMSLHFSTMDEAVNYALAHNPSISAAKYKKDAAEAYLNFLDNALEQCQDDAARGQLLALAEAAERTRNLADKWLQAIRESISFGAKQAYLGCLQAQSAAELAKLGVELAERQFSATSTMASVGAATQKDVYSAQLQLVQAQEALARAESALRSAKLVMAELLGTPPDTSLQIEEESIHFERVGLSADQLAEAASTAKANRYEVFAARQSQGSEANPLEGNSSILASLPPDLVASFLQNYSSLASTAADWEVKAAEFKVMHEVYAAYEELLTAQARYDCALQGVFEAEEALRAARVKLAHGAASPLEVKAAEYAAARARFEKERALYSWYASKLKYSYVQGNGFSLPANSSTTGEAMSR
ncbi:MAG TPA: TolC family protein [Firmicutes bacterium]|nr:TolC family protein [Bacillota bacterium]